MSISDSGEKVNLFFWQCGQVIFCVCCLYLNIHDEHISNVQNSHFSIFFSVIQTKQYSSFMSCVLRRVYIGAAPLWPAPANTLHRIAKCGKEQPVGLGSVLWPSTLLSLAVRRTQGHIWLASSFANTPIRLLLYFKSITALIFVVNACLRFSRVP